MPKRTLYSWMPLVPVTEGRTWYTSSFFLFWRSRDLRYEQLVTHSAWVQSFEFTRDTTGQPSGALEVFAPQEHCKDSDSRKAFPGRHWI